MDISNDGDTASARTTPMTQNQHALLYVVQRCWHSGPTQHVPVDMLRLFHTQREAEEAAYHSAMAFHEAHAKPSSGAVKTLLLPSYPAHNPQGSSYGFLACGGLFWVRALRATVVVSGNNGSDGMCHSAAYAIFTEGVIGGTGNRNSRRGTEVCDGRVFGGDATAKAIAEEAVARVRQNLINRGLVVEAEMVPVGKPQGWLSSGAFAGDWPVQAGFATAASATDGPFGTVPKRQMEGNFGAWGRSVSRETMDDEGFGLGTSAAPTTIGGLPVVECPFEGPRAKRRRVVSMAEDNYGMEEDTAMT